MAENFLHSCCFEGLASFNCKALQDPLPAERFPFWPLVLSQHPLQTLDNTWEFCRRAGRFKAPDSADPSFLRQDKPPSTPTLISTGKWPGATCRPPMQTSSGSPSSTSPCAWRRTGHQLHPHHLLASSGPSPSLRDRSAFLSLIVTCSSLPKSSMTATSLSSRFVKNEICRLAGLHNDRASVQHHVLRMQE